LLDWRARPLSLSGHERVEAPLYCVLTRVRLRHFWQLPHMWRYYFQIRRESRQISQLKRSLFLIEDFRTFLILSIWEDESGFLEFGTFVMSHLNAVRESLTKAERQSQKPEIWSTEWRIWAASNYLSWDGPQDWRYLLNAEMSKEKLSTAPQLEGAHQYDSDEHRS
jgi:hypothetical protein